MKKKLSTVIQANYYEVLGLKPNASKEEIKKAYYKMAKLYHPDVKVNNNNTKFNHGKFKEMTNAYNILSNEKNRIDYDINFKKSGYDRYNRDFYTHRQNYSHNYNRNHETRKENYYKYNNYNNEYNNNKNNSNDKFFYCYHIDPYTREYIRVKVFYNDVNYRNPNRNHYNDNDTESEEVDLEINYKVYIFLLCILSLFLWGIKSIFKHRPRKPIIYNKTIYYPINNDPLMERLRNRRN